MMKFLASVPMTDVTIPDAPAANEASLRFFTHPPSDLEEMHISVTDAGINSES